MDKKAYVFQSGEIVRDIGVIQLYKLLKEIDHVGEIQPQLTSTYLEFNLAIPDLAQRIFDYLVYQVLHKGFINDLTVEKLEPSVLGEIEADIELGHLAEILEKHGIASKKIEAIVKKSKTIYFPYLRNSGKFGANSQKIANFHLNLKTMIDLFLEGFENQQIEHLKYGEGQKCSICHLKMAPFYDITHKYSIDLVEALPKGSRQIRKDSKYLYTFRGSQHNSFNNYGGFHESSSICFECEFLNLLFLGYVKISRPRYLLYCYDLNMMAFLQAKIVSKQSVYSYQSLFFHIAKMSQNSRIKLYQIQTDANKGIILENEESIDYGALGRQIKVMDLIDSFILREGTKSIGELKKQVKNYALNSNNEMVYSWMSNNLLGNDGQSFSYNYQLLCQLIEELTEGGTGMNETLTDLRKTGNAFKAFGFKFSAVETKNGLAFRLNQLVKSNNRSEIAYTLRHIFIGKQKVSQDGSHQAPVWLPKDFSEKISESTNKELSYYIGCFIEGMYASTKGEKKQ